jgi:hypothetical protein
LLCFEKLLVFDEGTESADIATNEKILLLDEYSKVKVCRLYIGYGQLKKNDSFSFYLSIAVLLVFLYLISAYASVRQCAIVVLGEEGRRYKRGLDITIFFPNIAFYFFTTIK